MSGPIKSDWIKLQPINIDADNALQHNVFAAVAQWFDKHPGYRRIASNYGVGGTGFGFRWESGAPRGGAFGVWRNVSSSLQTGTSEEPSAVPPYDVVLVLGDGAYTISATSSWEPAGSAGVWYTLAYHSSSASWNGTTNNNGQDNWSTRPWKSGSIVLCRANGSGATCSSSLSALTRLDLGGSPSGKYELVITGDYDTTAIGFRSDEGGGGYGFNRICVFGGYQRTTASVDVPLVNLKLLPGGSTTLWASLGTLTPDAADCGIATKSSIGVKKFVFDVPRAFLLNADNPADGLNGNQYAGAHNGTLDTIHNYIIEWPITVMALEWDSTYDSLIYSHNVFGGILSNYRVTGLNGTLARAYDHGRRMAIWWSAGTGGPNDFVMTLPWDSGSTGYRTY